MTPVRLALPLVAMLLLATPSALAAPARGELVVDEIVLAPDATLAANGLDALWRGTAAPALDVELTDVSIHRLGQQRVDVGGTGPGDTHVDGSLINERAQHAAARITLEQGTGTQLTALRTLGPATAAVPDAILRGVGGALLGSAVGVHSACTEAEAPYCLDVFGVYELQSPAPEAQVSGPVTLLLYGPTLVVDAAEGRATYASGVRTANGADPVRQVDDAWVLVTGTTAGTTLRGDGLRLFTAAPTLETTGAQLRNAEGSIRVGLTEYRAASDEVRAAGQLVLTPGAVPRAADNGIADEPTQSEPVYASAFGTRISGDVASINLDGAPAFLDSPAERAGAAALLMALVGGIAYAWQHVAFLAAALYTRLNKPDILDNDVRNRIYDIIVQNPGISAREVHRQSSQSWGTVVYHLRQLERHHLVVSRALGRTRNYYENHGKYRGMEVQLACLQSDRALALAREIALTPGITQEQLAERCQFPQPTTSYYVRKLKQAGLVLEQREGRYAKYVPHADLPRFIALSDHAPQVGGAAASGVQA